MISRRYGVSARETWRMIFGGLELLVFLALGVVLVALPVWGVVDAAQRSDAEWAAIGQSRTLWIVLPLVGFVTCGLISFVAAIIYFSSIRPQFAAHPAR